MHSFMKLKVSRRRLAAVGGAMAAGSMAGPALAQERRLWRMVTSWPANAPGPGTSANRLARRITELSQGRLVVEVYGAGELVPAFEVFDAVSLGTAEIGHTASLFWAGKMPAAPFFTTIPFGLDPVGHEAWIYEGGGQAIWDDLYAPYGVKPYLAGNSGMTMGGWFNRPIETVDDLGGLVQRIVGLGGEVMRRLGVSAVSLPPGEIFGALQAGTIDGAEFLGPWSDMAMGFDRASRFYYWPGFNKPNGSAECIVNRNALAALPEDLQDLVAVACESEAIRGLAEANWQNAMALERLKTDGRVELRAFPEAVLSAAHGVSVEVLDGLAGDDAAFAGILASYRQVERRLAGWAGVTQGPMGRWAGL
ncbi:MAG: TRAP transporter substrate-binding protein [Rhodospirillaceae bacterium]|nr:TRAP transporter substrate-binding protein [Rhodospirillaceae bacterium]